MTTKVKKIGVLCSGGDSPGMNCAIRAVTRSGIGQGLEVVGVQRGYQGLIDNRFRELTVSSVGNILHTGGTILQTSRSKEFETAAGRTNSYRNLKKNNVDGLVVIGGNGSFKGALALSTEFNYPVVGIPGTIDNDISGTDYTIGFDTAVQTGIEAVDKIRDTASSHERTFIVEVMGRKSPAIAVHVGVCCGAENIVFPFKNVDFERIAHDILRGINRGKNSSIIIVAEGEKPGFGYEVEQTLEKNYGIAAHVCVLGHIQRGGHPSHRDRFIGAKMGNIAVKGLQNATGPQATVFSDGEVKLVDLNRCIKSKIDYEKPYLELVRALSI